MQVGLKYLQMICIQDINEESETEPLIIGKMGPLDSLLE